MLQGIIQIKKLLASELPLPVTLIVNPIYIPSITPMTPISALINKN
jgi:hypothetical protein